MGEIGALAAANSKIAGVVNSGLKERIQNAENQFNREAQSCF
jgi:uncharacterized lipoprotein YajG